jgi:two-component system response regulator EvgA
MNVLIYENQPIAVIGYKLIIEKHFKNAKVFPTNNQEEFLVSCKENPFELIILGNISSINAMSSLLSDIKTHQDNAKILICTEDESGIFDMSLMSIGANGVISKRNSEEDFVIAINGVLAGFAILPQNAIVDYSGKEKNLNFQGSVKSLSKRELDVFKLLSIGESVNNICKALDLHQSTISTLKKRIMEKLGAKNIVDMLKVSQEYEMSY